MFIKKIDERRNLPKESIMIVTNKMICYMSLGNSETGSA